MKATVCRLAALLALALAPSLARAQCCYYTPIPRAPDMCGPGLYNTNCYTAYGPLWCVRPPFPPYNGVVPGPAQRPGGPGGPGSPLFPTHPFARSPRDFYMVD
jgi:hypothetical protein